jgi:hypothetical protein
MEEPIDPATRPSRLSSLVHAVVVLLLSLAFITGVLVWWGRTGQEATLDTPSWLRAMVVLHGGLNPFLCALFGYLCCQHIRVGWQLRANVATGLATELVFAGLILSGVGLYYAGSESTRSVLVMTHRVMGLLLPAGLAAHWWAGLRWSKNFSK